MNKKFYAAKLLSIRPTFPGDITDVEKKIMHEHGKFWDELLNNGSAVMVGPVFHEDGAYGFGVVTADSIKEAKEILQKDPASQIAEYEVNEMRLILSPYYMKELPK